MSCNKNLMWEEFFRNVLWQQIYGQCTNNFCPQLLITANLVWHQWPIGFWWQTKKWQCLEFFSICWHFSEVWPQSYGYHWNWLVNTINLAPCNKKVDIQFGDSGQLVVGDRQKMANFSTFFAFIIFFWHFSGVLPQSYEHSWNQLIDMDNLALTDWHWHV